MTDQHGNQVAVEGVTRCSCGAKYWENDRCVDCGSDVPSVRWLTPEEVYVIDLALLAYATAIEEEEFPEAFRGVADRFAREARDLAEEVRSQKLRLG